MGIFVYLLSIIINLFLTKIRKDSRIQRPSHSLQSEHCGIVHLISQGSVGSEQNSLQPSGVGLADGGSEDTHSLQSEQLSQPHFVAHVPGFVSHQLRHCDSVRRPLPSTCWSDWTSLVFLWRRSDPWRLASTWETLIASNAIIKVKSSWWSCIVGPFFSCSMLKQHFYNYFNFMAQRRMLVGSVSFPLARAVDNENLKHTVVHVATTVLESTSIL